MAEAQPLVAPTTVWPIPDEQRQSTIARVKANILSVAFFSGHQVDEPRAEELAAAAEKKAYTAACVASRTTTGERPAVESLQAYARKLSQLVLEAIQQQKNTDTINATATTTTHGNDTLDISGDRDFLTSEGAESALAPLLAPSACHKRIKFSTQSFGHDAAAVAAKALKNIANTLEEADLSDIIAGRPEAEALSALTVITDALQGAKLKLLDLSDNALGEKGIRACAKALTSQTALESIAFQNVGCSVKACAALDELLSSLTSLRRIALYNNMSADEGAQSIARILSHSPHIEDFKMVSSRVGPEGGAALADALAAAGTALIRLDLHDNPLTAEVAPPLARVLTHHPQLRVLNMNDTSLTDEGVAVLASALVQGAPQLEELHLALNEITPTGARPLAHMLASKKHLQVVNLRENELEDEGGCLVMSALKGLPSLRSVDLCANQLKRAASLAAVRFATATPSLELLSLDENEFPEDAVESLQGAFAAAGRAGVLGPLEENMGDEDEGDEEDGGHEVVDAAEEELAAMLQRQL